MGLKWGRKAKCWSRENLIRYIAPRFNLLQQKTSTSVSLKNDFLSLIFVYLKQILKLLLFILFIKKINYLWEKLYKYLYLFCIQYLGSRKNLDKKRS